MNDSVEAPSKERRKPVLGFCRNPACYAFGVQHRFVGDETGLKCPKCKGNEATTVGRLVLIHLLRRDPAGPITGAGGLRYVVSCDPSREDFGSGNGEEAATGDPSCANCPDCLEAFADRPLS